MNPFFLTFLIPDDWDVLIINKPLVISLLLWESGAPLIYMLQSKESPHRSNICVSVFDTILHTWEPMYAHFFERAIWRAAGQYTFIESAFPWMLQQSVKPQCHFPSYSAYRINPSYKSVILCLEREDTHTHSRGPHRHTFSQLQWQKIHSPFWEEEFH